MTIRPYTPADRAACLAIFESNMPRYFAPDELPGFARWLDAQDAGRLAYAESLAEPYFVVEVAGQVVACGGLGIYLKQPLLTMAWGMVRNDLHHQGTGRALLQHRLQFAATHHPSYAVVLDTSQHTYPFFEKLGFQVTKVTPDGYGPGLHRYDMQRPAQR
ncbi:GNAT family N-acetyltransferase [Hymenobacter sp. ASUV-10]|uniref:GNAT family N-acetyltransferase n=1 Tax=Hymenobacter aranciens TaxID=3063996 RepID=A0ABT9BCV9_9BACT|nr:GNAT family N-acetyltransferase [Hymenobacter sp. ASUV-10]MDO7874541.1 GNAT family N-acetyltransferase [Hymenobacter sp. ASUV-10]